MTVKFANRWGKITYTPPKPVPMSDVTARLNLNADRLPSRHYSRPAPLPVQQPAQSIARMNLEKAEAAEVDLAEYEQREAEAKERKFTIMPSHKSNYVVVTNEEQMKVLGKKP